VTNTLETASIHQKNADWWNETSSWYGKEIDHEIEFLRSGGIHLFESERQLLGDIKPWCKRAIHLQCSHGNEALSLLNYGASEVIGVDISENLLEVARYKAETLNARATFIQFDILETPHSLNSTANLVYTGKGAICWMMDIKAWASVVSTLLKPNGVFFIYESHPMDWVWNVDAAEYVLDPKHGDYFSDMPRTQLFSPQTKTSPHYRQWTLSDVINSLIGAGLTIECLMEYPEPFWKQFYDMPDSVLQKLPHSFAILARKK